ncbi:hypothetical protein KR009_004768 [Drosophila setifemur]|nr:hypothetical protein KR009_004768 [Drosophila setifemur]
MSHWPAPPGAASNGSAHSMNPPTSGQELNPLPPPPPTGQHVAPSGLFPGSLTPGWNDPPPLSGNAMASSAGNRRPRLDLRKRVAYPVDGLPQASVLPPALPDAGSPRPVAMVPPQRQLPTYPEPSNLAGGGPGVAGGAGGLGFGSAMRVLPPVAGSASGVSISLNPSNIPVAKVPPRTK